MRKELTILKKELAKKKINQHMIGIDILPMIEGFCIYDARSVIEVFYYERGNKFNLRTFTDITEAITHFKELVLSEPSCWKSK
jgi:hypothetical protein